MSCDSMEGTHCVPWIRMRFFIGRRVGVWLRMTEEYVQNDRKYAQKTVCVILRTASLTADEGSLIVETLPLHQSGERSG